MFFRIIKIYWEGQHHFSGKYVAPKNYGSLLYVFWKLPTQNTDTFLVKQHRDLRSTLSCLIFCILFWHCVESQ